MSLTPVAERLQVKRDRRLAVIGAAADVDMGLGAADRRADLADADVVLLFVRDAPGLAAEVPRVLEVAPFTAILWVAYPKLSSPLAGDLSRDIIRAEAPRHSLHTVSQIAIDQDWSALRLKRVGGQSPLPNGSMVAL